MVSEVVSVGDRGRCVQRDWLAAAGGELSHGPGGELSQGKPGSHTQIMEMRV